MNIAADLKTLEELPLESLDELQEHIIDSSLIPA